MGIEAFERVMVDASAQPVMLRLTGQNATAVETARIRRYLVRQGELSPAPGPARAAGTGVSALLADQVGAGSPGENMPQSRSVAQRRHSPAPIPDPARTLLRLDVLAAYLAAGAALGIALLAIRLARRR